MSVVSQLATRRRLVPLLLAIAVGVALALAVLIDATPGGTAGVDVDRSSAGGSSTAPSSPGPSGRDASGATAEPYALGDDGASAQEQAKVGSIAPAPAEDAIGGVSEPRAADASTIEGGGIGATGANIDLGLKVLQTGSLTITYRRGRLDEGYSRIGQVARGLGGYVVSSSRSSSVGDDGPQSATITIRVPNGRFQGAIDRLDDGGKVTQLDISSQDVTQEYVDAKSRLRHDEAVEGRLLGLLGKADSVADALVIQDRLATLQQSIEVEKGRIAYLDKLTALATIDVTLRERGARDSAADERDGWGVGEAFGDAAHNAVDNLNRAIVWIGGALPGLVLLAVALLAARVGYRRWQRGSRYSELRGSVVRTEETGSNAE